MPRYLVPPKSPATSSTPAPAPPKTRLGPADLAWVARVSLDRRKLLVAFAGLLAAALAFFVFASLGNVIGSEIVRTILRYLGAGLAYLILAFTCFVLARMVQFQARTGGVRAGIFDTVAYCAGRLSALCLTPGGAVLAALVAVGLIGLLAALGRLVPTVFAFFFLVEFALGVVAVVAGLLLTWGLFLYPAILAVEETDEHDTIKRCFRLYHEHGLPLAGYEAVALVVTWVAAAVPGLVAVLGLVGVAGVARPIMGDALAHSVARVPQVLSQITDTWLTAVTGGLSSGLEDLFGATAARGSGGVMYGFCGAFLGISLLILVAATLAYALVFFVAAGTRTCLAYAPPETDEAAEQRAAA